mgnify:CR=1 FL=1
MNLPFFISKRISKEASGSFSSIINRIAVVSIGLGLAVLMLLAAFALIAKFKIGSTEGGNPISMRYFIFLTPLGIIVSTHYVYHFVCNFGKNYWIRINFVLILLTLLINNFINNKYFFCWLVVFGLLLEFLPEMCYGLATGHAAYGTHHFNCFLQAS